MYRNYLKLAIRNLWRHRVVSAINIFGLALGISASVIIFQFVSYELNCDSAHKNGDRVFRLTLQIFRDGNPFNTTSKVNNGYGPEFMNQIPEILDQIRIHNHTDNYTVTVNPSASTEGKFIESGVYYTDSSFFDFFSFPILKGDRSTMLSETYSVAISDQIAEKYYGKDWQKMPDLLDRTIILNSMDDHGLMPFNITGVFASESNSHFQPDILLSYSTLTKSIDEIYGTGFGLGWFEFHTYFLIHPNSNAGEVKQKIEKWFDKEWSRAAENGITWEIGLQAMEEIYLHSHYPDELKSSGNPDLLRILIVIALFILVIAWFNYINLATLQTIKRTRETGIRKSMGAQRNQLIRQYLVEALLLNLICIIISLLIIQFMVPLFKGLIGKAFVPGKLGLVIWSKGYPSASIFFWLIAGIFAVSTFISGLCPALIHLRTKTAIMLKEGVSNMPTGRFVLQKVLVTTQFVIAVIMMVSTFVIYQQLTFMLGENAGFRDEGVLVFRLLGLNRPVPEVVRNSIFVKEEILKLPMVEAVSTSSSIPGKEIRSKHYVGSQSENNEFMAVQRMQVGREYFEFYDLQFLAGGTFPPGSSADTSIARYVSVINESLMTQLGYKSPDDAIGKKIFVQSGMNSPEKEILGVIKNYHHGSYHHDYIPIEFSAEAEVWFHPRLGCLYFSDAYTIFSVKLKQSANGQVLYSDAVEEISGLLKTSFPDLLFESYPLHEFYNRQYTKDLSYGRLIGIFSLLAIFISSMGLFGLSLFMIQRSIKEMGIRKAFGAITKDLFRLLIKKYIILILIAVILSLPLAWWLLQKWLQQYTFRVELKWWAFIIPVVAVLFIAMVSVSYQTIKATYNNPAEALRYE
jgi:putative ABC transport system permease protein